MFGLFKKQKQRLTVTAEDKAWVEQQFVWMIEAFGMDHLQDNPFIVPTLEVFPYDNLNDPGQFQKFFERMPL